jgi:hypothetical protein
MADLAGVGGGVRRLVIVVMLLAGGRALRRGLGVWT